MEFNINLLNDFTPSTKRGEQKSEFLLCLYTSSISPWGLTSFSAGARRVCNVWFQKGKLTNGQRGEKRREEYHKVTKKNAGKYSCKNEVFFGKRLH